MFDVPLSEISEIHFKPYTLTPCLKVITNSQTIRIYNLQHYPLENIQSSLETYLHPYEQLQINIVDL